MSETGRRGKSVEIKPRDIRFEDQVVALFKKTSRVKKRSVKLNSCVLGTTILIIIYLWSLDQLMYKYFTTVTPENRNGTAIDYDIINTNTTIPFFSDPQSAEDVAGMVPELDTPYVLKIEAPEASKLPFLGTETVNEADINYTIATVDAAPYSSKDEMYKYLFDTYTTGNAYNEFTLVNNAWTVNDFDPNTTTLDFVVYFNGTNSVYEMLMEMTKNETFKGVTRTLPFGLNHIFRLFVSKIWAILYPDDVEPNPAFGYNLTGMDPRIGYKTFPNQREESVYDIVAEDLPFDLGFTLQLIFPIFLYEIVYERERGLMSLMKSMGVTSTAYWIVCTVVFNYLLYLIQIGSLYVPLYLLDFGIVRKNNFFLHFVLFLIWGINLIATSKLVSRIFKKTDNVFIGGYGIVLFFSYILPSVYWITATDPSTPESHLMAWHLVPSVSLVSGLMYLIRYSDKNHSGLDWSALSLDSFRNPAWSYISLAIEAVVMFLLDFLIEYIHNRREHSDNTPLKRRTDLSTDRFRKDILREKKRVKRNKEQFIIRAIGLSKVYDGNTVAIEDLHLGIPGGMIYGVLGPNGSGKTTMMKIISGVITSFEGDVRIGSNLRIPRDNSKISSILGICPQDDVLWDQLTGYETLEFFAKLAGFEGEKLKERVNSILAKVNLISDKNKLVSEYSGGMKRRVNIGIAFVTDANIILLDEPSTGLDPKTRRQLWNFIKGEVRPDRVIVLTTHSLEEADYLCDDLAIISAGRLRTVGSPQVLKKRFGKGYRLVYTVNDPEKDEELDRLIQKTFPTCIPLYSLNGTRSYEFSEADDLKVSLIFKFMSENRDKYEIADFGVSNSSLEDAYLKITRNL